MRMYFGADDESYLCMGNGQDEFGNRGIYLRKTIIEVTTNAVTEALNALAPHVLPLTELVRHYADVEEAQEPNHDGWHTTPGIITMMVVWDLMTRTHLCVSLRTCGCILGNNMDV